MKPESEKKSLRMSMEKVFLGLFPVYAEMIKTVRTDHLLRLMVAYLPYFFLYKIILLMYLKNCLFYFVLFCFSFFPQRIYIIFKKIAENSSCNPSLLSEIWGIFIFLFTV